MEQLNRHDEWHPRFLDIRQSVCLPAPRRSQRQPTPGMPSLRVKREAVRCSATTAPHRTSAPYDQLADSMFMAFHIDRQQQPFLAGPKGNFCNPMLSCPEGMRALAVAKHKPLEVAKAVEEHLAYFQAIISEPREHAEWLPESERPPLHLLRYCGMKT